MNNENQFDKFLRNELKMSSVEFEVEDFRERVLNNLPVYKRDNRIRYMILLISGVLACILFFVIIDFNIIANALAEIHSLINGPVLPSKQTIIFIIMLCFIFVVLPGVEYDSGVV